MPFNMLQQKADKYKDLETMEDGPLSSREEQSCLTFVGEIYGKQMCTSLNALRAFKASHSVASKRLPLISESFHFHLLWCVYPLMIWKEAFNHMLRLSDAVEWSRIWLWSRWQWKHAACDNVAVTCWSRASKLHHLWLQRKLWWGLLVLTE